MVQFKSSAGNSNILIVNRSELKGRWEPLFYSQKYQTVIDKIHSSPWIVKTVKQLAKRIADGPFGSDLKVDEYQMSGVPLLRVSNLRTGKIAGKLVYISAEKNEKLKRSKVYPKDVVLTKAGAILGYSAVFPEDLVEGNITSHLVTISCSEEINPYYLSLFFKSEMGQSQIYQWGNKSTRPELNTGEVKKIIVPVPPLEIQKEIVEKNVLTLEIRDRKLDKAKEKLASIDAYLLNILGVVHEQKKLDVESRIFKMPFRNLVGKRFDPIFYNSDLDQFNKGKFTSTKLKTLIKEFSSGQGVGRQDQVSEDEGILQIRPTNLGPRGSFLFQKNIFVPDEVRHKRLQKGDVIFNNTNSQELVGKSTYWDVDLEATYSNHITVLRVDEIKIFPEYLALILNLYQKANIFYSICTNWNNQSGVGIDVLLDLNIPLPPLALQEEIISHIRQIRNEAKKLETEANLVLEKAKQEIEKMILGETV